MTKNNLNSAKSFLAAILCLCFQSPSLLAAEPSSTIKLATSPVSILSKRGTPYVKCAFDGIGRTFTTASVPWARAQAGTEHGLYDGFYMAAQNSKRDAYATFSEHAFTVEWLYVIKKNNALTPDSPDFFKKKFAADHGSARIIWLNKNAEKNIITGRVSTTTDSASSLELLNLGRIDVVLENNESLRHAFLKTGLDPDEFKIFIAKSKPLGIYFNNQFLQNEPEFLQNFNASMRLCRRDK